ncbi:acyl-CoA synthetase [Frankia sp. CNm7]|uniref:Acyl-CoA synthetase n=1 Tax=Frankia nepalensis TaxID=1836974 RepID=A0A937RLI2_9ACTN|nr:acyl-CoA synthetase [Frankia nepalensis]MBL7499354.1 acyl-CoA synthetase [Frankia nepalensis]MBL7514112.1 acyl-CoA synthetase [Frankia nepalensis]MBL7519915.1 acyl-CoA synthetase [Frankia nepalensis]MBL7632465.1 acyl-CoA synthetase [Frankia nepalensis]
MYPATHAAVTPDKAAVVMAGSGTALTYRELDERSARFANALAAAGLRRGDGLALLAENDQRCFEVYWAALRSGLYVTPVNHHLSPDEVAYIVDDCGAAALVVSTRHAGLAASIVAATPRVRRRFVFRSAGDAPEAAGGLTGHDDYEAALAAVPAARPEVEWAGADMLYSSGTTGRPKGIRPPLPEYRLGEPGMVLPPLVQMFYGMGPDTVYLSPAPVYHAAPLRFGGAVQALGGTVVVMERFDPVDALAAIERYRVTHSQWVPTMFVRMLKLPEADRARFDLSSHRVAVHAAAPCPPDVKRAMMAWWGPILHEYYAATEGAGITFASPAEWLARPGTVGRSALGTLHVCDERGSELATGEDGIVYFEREKVPFTYHGDEAATAAGQHPLHPTWTTVGDVGHLDADGYLYLTDRAKFMIISGGVNIYPQEIENVLALHPKVLDVAVIGIPDPEMGERVHAVVEPAPGVEPGPDVADELIAFVRDRIAHYKAPRGVDFVDELPRTPTGKLRKGVLRERYWSASPVATAPTAG